MDRLLDPEVTMFSCPVCHSQESRDELVEEIFQIDGKYVLVDRIPATVCARCGEETFSRETTEKVRLLVHGDAKPTKSLALQVFEFA
jgi:YgiT-type zinc finger domain-containing protein